MSYIAQGQNQSGGHGPGGGKKDDKVSLNCVVVPQSVPTVFSS